MTHKQAYCLFEALWCFTKDRGLDNRTFTTALKVAFPDFPNWMGQDVEWEGHNKAARLTALRLREWARALEDLPDEEG